MLHCIDGRAGWLEQPDSSHDAQATVEAALTIPCFLLLLLVLLQPICVLYTRSIMENAAAEVARLMATGSEESKEAYEAFALRRLAGVPDLSVFHAGGPLAWEVELATAEELGGPVEVVIEGAVRPLPLVGAFARSMFETNGSGDILLRVEVRRNGRPRWVGGTYEEWVG